MNAATLPNGMPAARVAALAARMLAAAPIIEWDDHGVSLAVRDCAIIALTGAGILNTDGTRTRLGDAALHNRALCDIVVLGWLGADPVYRTAFDALNFVGPRIYWRPHGTQDGHILDGDVGAAAVGLLTDAGLGEAHSDTDDLASMTWTDAGHEARDIVPHQIRLRPDLWAYRPYREDNNV